MDDKNKRLSAAKKKLQQYKSQKQKQEQECSKSDTLSKSQESLSSLINEDEEHNNDEDISANSNIQHHSPSVPPSSTQQQSEERTNENLQVNNQIIFTNNVSLENVEQQQKEQDTPLADLTTEQHTNTPLQNPSDIVSMIESAFELLPGVKEVCSEKVTILDNEKLVTVERSTQCESEEGAVEISQNMNDVIDSLQDELRELRQENSTLMSRESELINQLEAGERLVRDLRKEVNQFKQLGNQQKQLEELQDAILVVSKSKMTIAEELNNEQDKNKELLDSLKSYEQELRNLRSENSALKSDMHNLRTTLEEELKKKQILDEQRKHYHAHVEQLQSKLNNSAKSQTDHDHHHHHGEHDHHHHGGEHDHHHHGGEHDHHHHGGEHDHYHEGHSHDSECTGHNGHSIGDHKDAGEHSVSAKGSELIEMNKTLKRLEWENTTYKAELARLGPVTMTMKQLEPRVMELQDKNASLKEEVDRLEHLVIQLQGENDTIGDYITLYQSQRIALGQHAKENDRLVAALSKERNDLLQKLSELNNAVDELAKQEQQPNGSVIEERIRDLIVDVNSKVNETFSCSTCSGSPLMTV